MIGLRNHMNNLTFLSLVLASAVSASEARAGALAPSKTVDLVTISHNIATPASCPGIASATTLLDVRQNGDGTSSSFVIPEGMSFVVTGFDWVVKNGTPGEYDGASMLAVDALGTTVSLIGGGAAVIDPSGIAAGNVTLSPGFAVKSGSVVCAGQYIGGTQRLVVTARGFLTKK